MNQAVTTQEMGVSRSKKAIIEEAQRIEENCLFTSKGHYAAAHFWGKCHISTGLTIAILAAMVGTSAFAQLEPRTPFAVLGGVTSFVVAVLAAVSAFLKPNEKASAHHSAGNSFDSLLTRTRMFRTIDCWSGVGDDILEQRLKLLSEERTRLKATSAQPPYWAYKKAKKGIDEGEADYAVDSKPVSARKPKPPKTPPTPPTG